MKKMETVSKEWTTPKMTKSKNSLKLPSTQLARLPLLETLIDSMSITTIQSDLNGMRFAASKLKTTTLLQLLLGSLTHQRLDLDLFVDQLMSSMSVLKRLSTKENLNLHTCLSVKS